MADYRHARTGSLSIPPSITMNPASSNQARFDAPRSPPNTSHVPCKFFRQGACQAGSACPFSHDLGAASGMTCKYFAKGNCKFGHKCANVHMLPNGNKVHYKSGLLITTPALHLGSRTNPQSPYASSKSALTNSFRRADANSPFPTYGFAGSPAEGYHQVDRQPNTDNGLPTLDTSYSHDSSQYGSPPNEDGTRLGLGLSPLGPSPIAHKGLSVLDAPLPASFDSNGISHAARYPAGPWPSSVPNQFVDSPAHSLSRMTPREATPSDALKRLHHSAFGGNDAPTSAAAPASPPTQPADEYFGRRPMHSSRSAKSKLLSSSAPRNMGIDRDWDPDFLFGDLVPDTIKDDIYTPWEIQGKNSRAAEESRTATPSSQVDLNSNGNNNNNNATARAFGVASPLAVGSPSSRWDAIFQRQKQEEQEAKRHAQAANSGAFGHVGSPLRNSVLDPPTPGTAGASIEGVSALTQQLQHARLDGGGGESPQLAAAGNTSGTTSGSSALSGLSAIPHLGLGGRPSNGRGMAERHISSSSLGSNARFPTPIGEEEGEFVFSMDEDGDREREREKERERERERERESATRAAWKRGGGGVGGSGGLGGGFSSGVNIWGSAASSWSGVGGGSYGVGGASSGKEAVGFVESVGGR